MGRSLALAAVLALLLAAGARASADMQDMENPAQTASALSLQALAMLDRGLSHEAALQKLDAALAAGDKSGIDLRALRAAHQALEDEQVAEAHRLLHGVFPGQERHLVGVTYRPDIGGAELAAGIAGVAGLALAVFGILRRRRADRKYAAA